jgi:MFS family permease
MSLHFAAGAVTAFHWSLLSDHIGRKAVLLTTLAGTAFSVILFGFSRSFWAILFRCLTESSQLRDLLTVVLFVTVAVFMAH